MDPGVFSTMQKKRWLIIEGKYSYRRPLVRDEMHLGTPHILLSQLSPKQRFETDIELCRRSNEGTTVGWIIAFG